VYLGEAGVAVCTGTGKDFAEDRPGDEHGVFEVSAPARGRCGVNEGGLGISCFGLD